MAPTIDSNNNVSPGGPKIVGGTENSHKDLGKGKGFLVLFESKVMNYFSSENAYKLEQFLTVTTPRHLEVLMGGNFIPGL